MLHSTDRHKDFEKEEMSDWTGKNNYGWLKFYAIANLALDGFIHADGSLYFELKIKRHNFQDKLAKSETIIKEIKAESEKDKDIII